MLVLKNPEGKRRIIEKDFENWPQERLEQRLAIHARKNPMKIALKDPWRTITYKELDNQINDLAVSMKNNGITRNSVVMMQLPNISESMIVFHAALRVGAVILPVTPIYRESEIRSILKQVTPDLIFTSQFYRKHDYVGMFNNLRELSGIPLVGIKINDETSNTTGECISWLNYISNMENERLKELKYEPEEYSLLMFTSGTTASPKGVLHTHGTLGVAISTFDGIETTSVNSCFLVASPVTHITGVVVGILGPMKIGATSIMMPNWNPKEALRIIDEEKCDYIMASTPFLSQLIEEKMRSGQGLDSLKYFACGGADVSEYLLEKAKNIVPSCIFSRIYGSTEAPGISKFEKSFSKSKRISHDGRPTEPCKVRIKKDSLLPDGSGELEVYGPQLFMRYIDWKETEKMLEEEWFSTGDLAIIDDEGFIQITGRDKDIIIRGGENFSAKEIEDILITHPFVIEVAIVGVKDEIMGERACAFVVLKEGIESIDLEMLLKLLQERKIAKQKWPERLEIVPTLPYTHSGKLQKFLLREMINKN